MPKIMIVDDDATIQMELEEYLTHMNFTVVGTADTGEGAIEMARETDPDLILMDINLPGEMDGISAGQKIKEEMDVAVVFITGFGDPEYIERAKRVEPFGYVMKPFDEREINGVIEIALYKKEMELKLKKANEQLEQSNRDLKQEVKERERAKEALRESNKKYKQLFNHAPAGIFEVDFIRQKFVNVNDVMCEYTGYTREEMLSMSPFDILTEESKKPFTERLTKLLAGETVPRTVEFRIHGKDGREFWVLLNSNFLYENGKLKGATVVVHDITDRKQAQEALRESEERFRTIADFTHDWESWIAPDGHCIYVSPSCERITGYSSEAFVNDPGLLEKIVHSDDHSSFVKRFGEEQGLEKLPSFDYRIITRSGEERWISHVCQAVYGTDGTYLGRRGSNRDVSKQKQMEAQLREANKMEAIAILAGGVAHEFNNALMGIMGNLELLEMDLPKDERQDRYFEAMKDSGYRMSHLTDQLLAYAQGGKYQPRDLKLNDFVLETLPILQHDINPNVRVKTHFPKDISHIKADSAQMQMVLSTILANSNEAIEDEGFIRITAVTEDIDEDGTKHHPGLNPGNYACLTIEDNGKGMSEEEREKVFDPFFTTKFQGRGMGMAAVYGIVKSHDGFIYVDSELGKGTVVQIYLPAVSVGVKKQEPEEVKKPERELAMGEGTILVIEDEAVLLEMNRKILERLGYRVLEAKTGKEGVDIANAFDGQIDLALLDIKLPDMSGNRVYPLIMEARPDLKVVVCSGYSIDGPARDILDAGAEGFIQKPFLIAALAEKLKAVLEGK